VGVQPVPHGRWRGGAEVEGERVEVNIAERSLEPGTVAENARDRETRRRRIVQAQRRSEARGQLTLFGG